MTHLLLALIVISGTLATYLFYESHTMSVELDNLQPQAREIVRNYDLNLPNVQKFVRTLVAYGQTHPDYQPHFEAKWTSGDAVRPHQFRAYEVAVASRAPQLGQKFE